MCKVASVKFLRKTFPLQFVEESIVLKRGEILKKILQKLRLRKKQSKQTVYVLHRSSDL